MIKKAGYLIADYVYLYEITNEFSFYIFGLLYFRLVNICAVGLVVIATFAICWAPFLGSLDAATSVVQRLFPFSRGLFEVIMGL